MGGAECGPGFGDQFDPWPQHQQGGGCGNGGCGGGGGNNFGGGGGNNFGGASASVGVSASANVDPWPSNNGRGDGVCGSFACGGRGGGGGGGCGSGCGWKKK